MSKLKENMEITQTVGTARFSFSLRTADFLFLSVVIQQETQSITFRMN